jgi:hypothetical protein
MRTAGNRIDAALPIADHVVSVVLHSNEEWVTVTAVSGILVSRGAARPEDFVDVDHLMGFGPTQNCLYANFAPQDLPVLRIGWIVAWDIQSKKWPRVKLVFLDDAYEDEAGPRQLVLRRHFLG